MIIAILGLKGSGKTLFMCILLYIEWKILHSKVLSNLWFNFPHEIIDAKRLVELDESLKNSAIAIDELHMIADSRRSGAKQNLLMSYFVLQSRHRSVNVYFTDQFEHQYDRRIRDNTDIKIITENLHIDSDGDGLEDLFRIIVQDLRQFPVKYYITTIYAGKFFGMYDTDYLIDIFKYKKGDKLEKKGDKKNGRR